MAPYTFECTRPGSRMQREGTENSITHSLALALDLALAPSRALSLARSLSLCVVLRLSRALSLVFPPLAHFRSRHLSLSLSFSLILSLTQSSLAHWKVMLGMLSACISAFICV